MTAIILLIAALSLSAGFFFLFTGRRTPESGKPATHKLNIRKAAGLEVQEVTDEPPEGLSALECEAIALEGEEPIDIFLDEDLPWQIRLEAADKLKDAGFTINSKPAEDPDKSKRNECGVDKTENPTTDEDTRPPLELTGE